MALSLDDVVFDIYDAYKTTEDEQIKQGILKKRVHPDDFSASLKRQLKGLTDDELLSVSELLKEKISNSNINDIVYAQNGVVNINIPQSMINQGIDNAKFRRRGVSGASLETKPFAETVIEAAGTVVLAEYVQQFITPEALMDSGLFGGMDYETAELVAHTMNTMESYMSKEDSPKTQDVFKIFYNRSPFKHYISEDVFDKLGDDIKTKLFAHPSKFANALKYFKSNSPEEIAKGYEMLNSIGIDEEVLRQAQLTQSKLVQMSNDSKYTEDLKRQEKEKKQHMDDPDFKLEFHTAISTYLKEKNPNWSEEYISLIMSQKGMTQVMLDSFVIDDNGKLIISEELSGALVDEFVEKFVRTHSYNSKDSYKKDYYKSDSERTDYTGPHYNTKNIQAKIDLHEIQSQIYNNPDLAEYIKRSDFVSNHNSNDLVSRQLVALKVLQSRSNLVTQDIDELQKVTDMKQTILEAKPVKEKFSEEIVSYIKAKYPSISLEQLESLMESPELHTIQMNSFEIVEGGQVLVSDIIIRQLTDRFLSEEPVSIDALNTDRIPIDVTSIEDTITEYAYGVRDYFSYLQHGKEQDLAEDIRVEPQPRTPQEMQMTSTIPAMDDFLQDDDDLDISGISSKPQEIDSRKPDQSKNDTVSQENFTPTEPEISDKDAEPPLTEKAEDLIVDRSFEERSTPKDVEPDLADDNDVPSIEAFEVSPEDDSSTATSDSSTTSSNNTGMIVSEDKSAATVGGFWSNFMRHMREDKESKGFFGKIRSAFRKAREDRDKELGFAMDEPTEVSHSESPVEEPTFDDRYKVDMSGKSTPIAPQPEKSTTDTKQQNPEEPTQDTDEPLI